MITGVGEGARGLMGGHAGPPAVPDLLRGGRVVRRRRRRQGRMEAHHGLQVCEHALCSRSAVNPTASGRTQGQHRALVSETLVREELVRVLREKTHNKRGDALKVLSTREQDFECRTV